MTVIDVGARDDVHQFPCLQSGYLGQHVQENGILHHVPAAGGEHILAALIQDPIEGAPDTLKVIE